MDLKVRKNEEIERVKILLWMIDRQRMRQREYKVEWSLTI